MAVKRVEAVCAASVAELSLFRDAGKTFKSMAVLHACGAGSVVVESPCLESESRLESPVSESEASPSHNKKIRVESESSPY